MPAVDQPHALIGALPLSAQQKWIGDVLVTAELPVIVMMGISVRRLVNDDANNLAWLQMPVRFLHFGGLRVADLGHEQNTIYSWQDSELYHCLIE